MEILDQLRLNGIDFAASEYDDESLFLEDVKTVVYAWFLV